MVRLEQIRYDKLDLTGKKGGEGALNSPSKKRWVHLTACLTVLGPMCHSLFSDVGEAQRLCWLLCSFPHSSSPYSFIFFSIHLKILLFLPLSVRAAETTLLSWGENKPQAPELLGPAFSLSQQQWRKSRITPYRLENQWLKLPCLLISIFKWQHHE